MSWDSNLLADQKEVVCKTGCHVCVLAGPGTGKTLTLVRRILYLVQESIVSSNEILALTFTRAASYDLRQRVLDEFQFGDMVPPRISTLHSFSLSQLLQNAPSITTVPRPLRIADDWEERYIIEEDIKRILSIDIRTVRGKFNQLSSDWQTLVADKNNWPSIHPDPQFLGAWQQHRGIYGYMLRSELVYQLKKQLEQNSDFTLEQSYKQILVDEYQDLNRCDLAVVKAFTQAGGQVFVTGDDDQSIYGFRFAHPQGIRMFSKDYSPCTVLKLEFCLRCDINILSLGLFVADLDPKRIPKPLKPITEAEEGEVHVLRFDNQDEEAQGVATICKYLIDTIGYQPKDILLLIRTDHNGCFSIILQEALVKANVPVVSKADAADPIDEDDGREFLAILRLLVNPNDHLAWRTLLQIRPNKIGDGTISGIYELAANEGLTFSEVLWMIKDSPEILPKRGTVLCQELEAIMDLITQFNFKSSDNKELSELLSKVAEKTIRDDERRGQVLAHVQAILESSEAKTLEGLLSSISVSLGDKEQDIEPSSVNILTMHKAKGLTAEAVFIIGAEDEYIPGGQLGEEQQGDERRLLYVSLTRARHALFITYCNRRTGPQKYTGRKFGETKRSLSRFLINAPIKPEVGKTYCQSLAQLDKSI